MISIEDDKALIRKHTLSPKETKQHIKDSLGFFIKRLGIASDSKNDVAHILIIHSPTRRKNH
jgi:hypothetical protein